MANKYSEQEELGPEDEMPFGKYEGHLLVDILRYDADYLAWVTENIEKFDLSDEIQEALADPNARYELIEEYS